MRYPFRDGYETTRKTYSRRREAGPGENLMRRDRDRDVPPRVQNYCRHVEECSRLVNNSDTKRYVPLSAALRRYDMTTSPATVGPSKFRRSSNTAGRVSYRSRQSRRLLGLERVSFVGIALAHDSFAISELARKIIKARNRCLLPQVGLNWHGSF